MPEGDSAPQPRKEMSSARVVLVSVCASIISAALVALIASYADFIALREQLNANTSRMERSLQRAEDAFTDFQVQQRKFLVPINQDEERKKAALARHEREIKEMRELLYDLDKRLAIQENK